MEKIVFATLLGSIFLGFLAFLAPLSYRLNTNTNYTPGDTELSMIPNYNVERNTAELGLRFASMLQSSFQQFPENDTRFSFYKKVSYVPSTRLS